MDKAYLKWKRANVSWRGESEQTGTRSATLGAGLYSAALSNKKMAAEYGKPFFLVGGVPDHPKVFNTLNDAQIFIQRLKAHVLGVEFGSDTRKFDQTTTIEKEMIALGYDGMVVKGREMVKYSPGKVWRFYNEDELRVFYTLWEGLLCFRVDHWYKDGSGSLVQYFEKLFDAEAEVSGMKEITAQETEGIPHTSITAFKAPTRDDNGWSLAIRYNFTSTPDHYAYLT